MNEIFKKLRPCIAEKKRNPGGHEVRVHESTPRCMMEVTQPWLAERLSWLGWVVWLDAAALPEEAAMPPRWAR